MAAPYGYTLVIWSTGALSIARWAPLHAAEIAAYVGGALASTFVLTLLSWGALQHSPRPQAGRSTAGNTMHWLAVPGSFTAAWGITRTAFGSVPGMFLAAFVATFLYQILVSLEHYFFRSEDC